MLGRKKLKYRSHGVPESRSFLVRYRRTYVLKTYVLNKLIQRLEERKLYFVMIMLDHDHH